MIFGPIEFNGLNLTEEQAPFEAEAERNHVTSVLEKSMIMPNNLCVHGYKVKVK